MASTIDATLKRKTANCPGEYTRRPARIPAKAEAQSKRAAANASRARVENFWIIFLPTVTTATRRPYAQASAQESDLPDVVTVVDHDLPQDYFYC